MRLFACLAACALCGSAFAAVPDVYHWSAEGYALLSRHMAKCILPGAH